MIHYYRYPIIPNFDFIKQVSYHNKSFTADKYKVEADILNHDIVKLVCNTKDKFFHQHSLSKIDEKLNKDVHHTNNKSTVCFNTDLLKVEFQLKSMSLKIFYNNKVILTSPKDFIGFNGEKIVYQFNKDDNTPFWGFGEKSGALNKRDQVLKMWNVDVMPEHPYSYMRDDFDPAYASIPFFIIYVNHTYIGFLLNNPCQTFFNNGNNDKRCFNFGSYNGESCLYIMPGPTIKEVVRKLSDLTGKIEMPPLWSIGHHQCRWSYHSAQEVKKVVEKYKKHEIPLSSVWLDIDYMDGYRVFTWNKKFHNPKKLTDWLHDECISLVTIVDPGVKKDTHYNIYKQGKKLDLFCKTYNGKDFVGYVWPGKTVFPDFTNKKTKEWWADNIVKFLKDGVDGIWIDMNDPSTGFSDSEDMLFNKGKIEHHYYHNQYANLMAEATKDGMNKFDKTKRSFILTRSAYTGIQRNAAVWTGDNVSKWEHLKMGIPESLNLSLSGVSFNGPDIGGFIDDTEEELITRWYETNFLFPFCRNHSALDTKSQEVYRFSDTTISIIKKYLNFRYKHLPYLYNLFYQNHKYGDPILRPLFYEFDNHRFFDTDDAFMIGENILHAPVVSKDHTKKIFLPEGYWYDYYQKVWIQGGREYEYQVALENTLLFIRDGAVIPVLPEDDFINIKPEDFKNTEFSIYLNENEEAVLDFYEDDCTSNAYKDGIYNLFSINAKVVDSRYNIDIKKVHKKYDNGIKDFRFNVYYKETVLQKIIEAVPD